MVCEFEITEAQLRAALAAIDACKNQGFSDTTAICYISQVKDDGTDVMASFSGHVILKAHPTDESKNWGNITVEMIGWYRMVNGKCASV